jgi:hypothetical protein
MTQKAKEEKENNPAPSLPPTSTRHAFVFQSLEEPVRAEGGVVGGVVQDSENGAAEERTHLPSSFIFSPRSIFVLVIGFWSCRFALRATKKLTAVDLNYHQHTYRCLCGARGRDDS